MVKAISVRLFRLYQQIHHPNVPTNESGTATLGMTVAGRFLQNRKSP